MDNTLRNKWQLRGVAIVIFSLGFTSGVLALNAYHWARALGSADRGDRFEQLATRLQMNADQKTKVQQIFGDARQQLQALRRESEPRVNDDSPADRSAAATGSDPRTVAAISADAK